MGRFYDKFAICWAQAFKLRTGGGHGKWSCLLIQIVILDLKEEEINYLFKNRLKTHLNKRVYVVLNTHTHLHACTHMSCPPVILKSVCTASCQLQISYKKAAESIKCTYNKYMLDTY